MKKALHLFAVLLLAGCFSFSYAPTDFSGTSPPEENLVVDIDSEDSSKLNFLTKTINYL